MHVYTAYLDESGTHDESKVTVVGGMLGRAEQWDKFQLAVNAAKKKYGFRIFHTKRIKARSGDFKGWSDEKMEAFLADLGKIIGFGLTEGVSVSLSNEHYKEFYKGATKPKKAVLDSAYGLCFRSCLHHFMIEIMKRKFRGKFPELHLVLEEGHKNAGDVVRIFEETKNEFSQLGFDALKTFKLAKKDECDPLMAADFLAHSSYLASTGKIAQPPDILIGQTSSKLPRRKEPGVGMMHYESTPEGLANMRHHTIEVLNKLVRRTRHGT